MPTPPDQKKEEQKAPAPATPPVPALPPAPALAKKKRKAKSEPPLLFIDTNILEQEDGKKRWGQMVTELSRAFALCAASDAATETPASRTTRSR